jgi:mRNA-degrading endonuclease toxin of MazEF toxin-antitoxin module
MIAALELEPARRHPHQGAVLDRVPIHWIRAPLYVLRPKEEPDLSLAYPRRADETLDAFRGNRGEETVLAVAKARPVIVASPHREIRLGHAVRVVPVYSYNEGGSLERQREAIARGEIPWALHLQAGEMVYEGAVLLNQARAMPWEVIASLGARPLASLTETSTSLLLKRLGEYSQILDRRECEP